MSRKRSRNVSYPPVPLHIHYMPVTVAHHLPSLVTPTPLPSLSFRDTQCPPAAEAASYTDSKPCICAERQDPGGVRVSNTVNILLRRVGGKQTHLRSSMRMVSMVFSLFQLARQGSCEGSTRPFRWFTQGRFTMLTNWIVGGLSGYWSPQCIFTE